jgi:hypothetical protein
MTWHSAQRGLVFIVISFCALGAIYSVVHPLFEPPDELWHFSFIRVLAAQRSLPVQPEEGKDMWLREAGQPPLYYLVFAPLVASFDTSDFPDFVRFNVAHPAVTAHSASEAPNVFIHTPHEAFPYTGAVLAIHILRLLTVLWGAGTIVGAYLMAREVVPTRPGLALAAAAITACNPHFICISSAVNNDAAAACLCTLALWLAIRLVREAGLGGKTLVSLGFVLGLALLSKVSALPLLALVPLALGLRWWRDRGTWALFVRGATIFGLAALIGAWWYVRNWALYGDPLAWDVWLIDIGVHPIGLDELLRQLGHVATSFWSPYDGLFPPVVFWALGLLALVAAVGWARMIVRREARALVNAEGLLLAGTWFILLFVSLIRYMMTTPSAEGRLLFPGIAAFALLVALGVEAVVSRRWTNAALEMVGAGLLALSVATPFCGIAPRFALPLVASVEEIEGEVPFEDAVFGGVRLLGVDVDPEEARSGERVSVTLYWEVRATPPDDLRAVVRLWTLGGRLVGQRDTTPAGEVYPPDLWREGDVVRDVYRLRIEGDGPAVCRVAVDVLSGDEPLGEASSPAVFKLAAAQVLEEQSAALPPYSLGDKIELTGYEVAGSAPLEVTLYWRALAQMDEDYTVFVHLLDGTGTLRGQGDGPPLRGDYTTSYWSPGEVLADTHAILLEDGLPEGAYLLVGLYRLADGVRLPAYTAAGERVPNDAIVLRLTTPQ